jgi:general secretion pathway protein E
MIHNFGEQTVMQAQAKFANFSFTIDVTWCLEQLQKDGRITERDKLLIQTTHRQKDQLKWHPLQWIASFNLKDQLNVPNTLTLNRLCLWLAEKAEIPLFVIDPLKADVAALTSVMSQEFAVRNHILAVDVQRIGF